MRKLLAVGFVLSLSTFAWAGGGSYGSNSGCGDDEDCKPDVCGYPKKIANNTRAGVVFTENDAIPVAGLTSGTDPNTNTFAAWYTEEFALILGVKEFDKTSSSKDTAAVAIGTPPKLGLLTPTYPLAETVDQAGRPVRPVIYLTDLTLTPGGTSGDWQMGGTSHDPTSIFGTGKGAISPVGGGLYGESPGPAQNHFNLGAGADTTTPGNKNFSAGGGFQDQGFSSEIAWSLSSLSLVSGHTYRAQVIVHQGDTASDGWGGWSWGGDDEEQQHRDVIQAGEYCTTFTAPQTTPSCSSASGYYSTNGGASYSFAPLAGTWGSCTCTAGPLNGVAVQGPFTDFPAKGQTNFSCGVSG